MILVGVFKAHPPSGSSLKCRKGRSVQTRALDSPSDTLRSQHRFKNCKSESSCTWQSQWHLQVDLWYLNYSFKRSTAWWQSVLSQRCRKTCQHCPTLQRGTSAGWLTSLSRRSCFSPAGADTVATLGLEGWQKQTQRALLAGMYIVHLALCRWREIYVHSLPSPSLLKNERASKCL